MYLFRSHFTLEEPWNNGKGLLLNTFTGALDIVSSEVVEFVSLNPRINFDESDPIQNALLERGYYVQSYATEEAIAQALAKLVRKNRLKKSRPKYVLSLTLQCNLSCSYCWQRIENMGIDDNSVMCEEQVNAAFNFIERDLKEKRRDDAFISLFGGEPITNTPERRELISYIGEQTKKRKMTLHFTTNGLCLGSYYNEIKKYQPSIQVTIDGVKQGHRGMLLYRSGQELGGLYETLTKIAAVCGSNLSIRFLVNEENISEFITLGDNLFSEPSAARRIMLVVAPLQNRTGIIDHRIPNKARILDRLLNALADKWYAPQITYIDWRSLQFFSPLRSGMEVLSYPAFSHCEANADLICFGSDGCLYVCYEAIGDPDLSVGEYWPKLTIDEVKLSQFRNRSAFSFSQCKKCVVAPICGGGCQVRAYRKKGQIDSTFCDSLSEEIRLVMRRWREVSRIVRGKHYVSKKGT